MTQITINHNGKIANIDAVSAVYIAMRNGAWQFKPLPEMLVGVMRSIDGEPITVKIVESTNTRLIEEERRQSPCSCVFEVELIELGIPPDTSCGG